MEPDYEAEDIGCECTEDPDCPMTSEWQWEPDQYCYHCAGCGEVQ